MFSPKITHSHSRTQAAAFERDAAKLRAAVAAAEGTLEVARQKRADILEEAAVEQVCASIVFVFVWGAKQHQAAC